MALSIDEHGNITTTFLIEQAKIHMSVIDGQHRFMAFNELMNKRKRNEFKQRLARIPSLFLRKIIQRNYDEYGQAKP